MTRYEILKVRAGEFIPTDGTTYPDYHAAFRALLDLATELQAIIVGCHSDHFRGEAEVFIITDGLPEEYVVREAQAVVQEAML